MSVSIIRILGVSSVLLATFLGGFLFVFAASVILTIDGENTNVVAVGETSTFSVEVSGEPTLEIFAYLQDADSGEDISAFSNISCGTGEDYFSDSSYIDCVWEDAFEGEETISFDVTLAEAGDYILIVERVDEYNEESLTEFSISAEEESVPLTFDSAETRDLDANGNIDAFKLTFSSQVDIDTVALGDISIVGYTLSDVSLWDGDNNSLLVTVSELDSFDSNVEPSITVSGISGTDGGEVSETTISATDMVSPVMVSAIIAEDGNSIVVTFSEDLNGTTVNSTGTDFTLSENTISLADETAPGVVTLTLGTSTTATAIEITVESDALKDLNGQGTLEHTITATQAPDTTPIVIHSALLTTFSIQLSSANGGMNLISLPFSPSNTAIGEVLSDISVHVQSVWTYIDGVWQVYYPNNRDFSTLTTMDAGFAYFIEVSADVTLAGEGTLWSGSRTLSSGWQLVGYAQPNTSTNEGVSIDTAFTSVGLAGVAYTDLIGYDGGTEATPVAVAPGEGLWMNVTTEGTLERTELD